VSEIPRAQVVATLVAALVVVVLGVRWIRSQATPGPAVAPAAQQATGGGDGRGAGVVVARAGGDAVLVHVAGAVRAPGVYRLRGDARVRDAVRRAGGATRHGDANAINLAAKLADGQQVVVPARAPAPAAAGVVTGAGAAAAASGVGAAAPSAPVNLNTATLEQLDTLDGVGPATAQKILDYRQAHGGFRSVDDLAEVPGIGPKRLAALREKVQV
jgi:competence protein ComEA